MTKKISGPTYRSGWSKLYDQRTHYEKLVDEIQWMNQQLELGKVKEDIRDQFHKTMLANIVWIEYGYREHLGIPVVGHIAADKEGLYIGRSSKKLGLQESVWKNPYVIDKHGDRDQVLRLYWDYILKNAQLLKKIKDLEGQRLLCWCRRLDQSEPFCHGDILSYLYEQWATENWKRYGFVMDRESVFRNRDQMILLELRNSGMLHSIFDPKPDYNRKEFIGSLLSIHPS